MIWRVLVSLAGAAVIAAATHLNVMRAGGYGSSDAPLIITVAVLLTIGMGYVGVAFNEGRRRMACVLFICILAGETYWIGTNAQREFDNRAAVTAPVLEAVAAHDAAQKRLDAAEAAKQKVDADAISEAAEDGCRKNCADILRESQEKAAAEVASARAALALAPMTRSIAPLPEKLGIAPWVWDLIMACLRSIAVVGGSIAIGMAWHPRRLIPTVTVLAPAATEPSGRRQSRSRRALPKPQSAALDPREHASQFLRALNFRPDSASSTSLRELHGEYPSWCRSREVEPLPAGELGQHLRAIIDTIGLDCKTTGRDVIVRGVLIDR